MKFSCGGSYHMLNSITIIDDNICVYFAGDQLQGKIFVRLQLTCASHIEFAYYKGSVGRPDLCAYCSRPDVQCDTELLTKFRVVLPVYGMCLLNNKSIPTSLGR